ncbi:MAG: Cytochrome [Rhodospirillales bacterium]|nr:Cytochrome [Rhodospirillales bacterium]
MIRLSAVAIVALGVFSPVLSLAKAAYDADGKLQFPNGYRSWVYLSSGFSMSYSPTPAGGEVFDNVFVDADSYKLFVETGTWPDGTELMLEIRSAEQKGSINKSGHFQGTVAHTEIHVKDTSRFKDGWAFFAFADQASATVIPTSANCYSCHQAHAAVDTTFVQFYPTLMPIAQAKKTLSPAYVVEEAKR